MFRVDNSMVEHRCCWDSAIVTDCDEGEGMYGGNVSLVCECDSGMVEIIVKALNDSGAEIVRLRLRLKEFEQERLNHKKGGRIANGYQ